MPSLSSTPSSAVNSALTLAENKAKEAEVTYKVVKAGYEALETRKRDLDEVAFSFRELARACQTQVQERVSSIVTRCLETIFTESKYTFRLIFEEKRNQTEVRCVLYDQQGNEYDPVNSTGGGVMDVVSFGLRVACLMLQKPQAAKVLIMDEPVKNLSLQYRAPMLGLLKSLAEELGMQFIMVTHIEEFLDGNVIEI